MGKTDRRMKELETNRYGGVGVVGCLRSTDGLRTTDEEAGVKSAAGHYFEHTTASLKCHTHWGCQGNLPLLVSLSSPAPEHECGSEVPSLILPMKPQGELPIRESHPTVPLNSFQAHMQTLCIPALAQGARVSGCLGSKGNAGGNRSQDGSYPHSPGSPAPLPPTQTAQYPGP